jgi:hypothetical protein
MAINPSVYTQSMVLIKPTVRQTGLALATAYAQYFLVVL